MISEQARQAFDDLLVRSIRSVWGARQNESAEMQFLPALEPVPEAHVAMLSVSSYWFRLVLLLHYDLDEPTRRHFAATTNRELSELNDQALRDAIAESCNLMCGALNRQITPFFPHVGMSTPRHLRRECVLSLEGLGAAHCHRIRLALSDGFHFHVTLAASAYATIDFAIDEEEQAECAGELELF